MLTTVLFALLAATAQSAPAVLPGEPCTAAALVGTWKVVKQTINGETTPVGPQEPLQYKHVTPTHWVTYHTRADGKGVLSWALGGTYTLSGGMYVENVQHGFGEPFNAVGGETAQYKCTTEGTTTWHTSGQGGDLAIQETLTRVSNN